MDENRQELEELEVLKLLQQGKRQKEIAEQLQIPTTKIAKIVKRLILQGKIEETQIVGRRINNKCDFLKKREEVEKRTIRGEKPKEIAKEMRIPLKTSYRMIQELEELGKLENKNPRKRNVKLLLEECVDTNKKKKTIARVLVTL